MYEQESDMSTVKIKPRNVWGIIRRKDGSNRKLKSIVIRPKLPRKELVDAYNAFEEADKVSQLLDKIDNLRKNQLIKNGTNQRTLEELAEKLVNNPVELERIGRLTGKKKWKMDSTATEYYNYTPSEKRFLESEVTKKLALRVRVTEVVSSGAIPTVPTTG
jgi:hypothetical protein